MAKKNFPGHKNIWILVCPGGCICLESGKEAFTWLSNLNAIIGMLDQGDIGAWLLEIQL